MTYDSNLNFYAIPQDLNNDPSIVLVGDLEEPYCPLPKETLFLSANTDMDKIIYLLEKLSK